MRLGRRQQVARQRGEKSWTPGPRYASNAAYRDRYPATYAGHLAVQHARRANLLRSDTCDRCGSSDGRIEQHHWSYQKSHRLDTEPLCRACHSLADRVRRYGESRGFSPAQINTLRWELLVAYESEREAERLACESEAAERLARRSLDRLERSELL